jgi:hypothetical protein
MLTTPSYLSISALPRGNFAAFAAGEVGQRAAALLFIFYLLHIQLKD